VLADLTNRANGSRLTPSPVHPSTRPPSPSQPSSVEPPATLHPKSGSPSTGFAPRQLPRRPTIVAQPDLAGEPSAMRGIPLLPPISSAVGKNAQGPGPLGRASRALLWAEPKCTMHFLIYLSNSFKLIQINSEFD
jgi:hypothetical protein